MSHLSTALPLMGRLLCYPEPDTAKWAERLSAELQAMAADTDFTPADTDSTPDGQQPPDALADATSSANTFAEAIRAHDLNDLEEAYTRTFDINPACALEVGWHLFGEEYIRGLFMVRIREEMRKYNVHETVELPDHIAHVLAVTAAMPAAEATRFVCACLLPAVKKMNLALANKETPYRHMVAAIESLLMLQWGEAFAKAQAESPGTGANPTGDVDLLHALPVSDVAASCGDCLRVPEDAVPHNAIPRESEFPNLDRQASELEAKPSHAQTTEPFDPNHPSFPGIADRKETPISTPARKR